MAIPSYVGAELTKESNTFEDWFNRTNSITTDLGSRVVHAQANTAGGTTTGNVNIVGIFSANTIAVKTALRGGTVELPDTLLISSNVNMNGGTSLVSNTINHTLKSNTFILTSNTVTASGNTFTINHTNVNVNATTSNFGGTTLNINVDAFNISSNTTFNANSVTISNLSLSESLTFANNFILTSEFINYNANNELSISANSVTISTLTLSESLTLANNFVLTSEFMNANANNELSISTNSFTVDSNATFNAGDFDVNATGVDINANTTITGTSLDITAAITIEGDTVANGDITAIDFNATSDITLKENIEPISNGLEILSQMNPVSFNWKQSGDRAYGFIAQEIEEILPDIISESDGIKSISYIQIISFLVDAIKKQEDRIKRLEERL